MFRLLNSNEWKKNIGDRDVSTTDQAKIYISNILKGDSIEYFVIEKLDDSTPIGILSYMIRDFMDYPDIGFALLPEYYHKGFALEATKEYLKNLFLNKQNLIVAAICKKENYNSIQLLEKIGFRFNALIEKDEEQLNLYLLNNSNLIK
ncbi:MAG: GNAT family N-acetyltransferase [Flavobacteriaceae bacterium]|nr:GNAT family N-acetyltransferase [Flavobacteriaceae bacterium]